MTINEFPDLNTFFNLELYKLRWSLDCGVCLHDGTLLQAGCSVTPCPHVARVSQFTHTHTRLDWS